MPGDRYALLIAADSFTDPTLRSLGAPARDIDDLASVLCDPAVGQFKVTMIVNQPSHNIAEAVETFFSDRRRDDMLLLYFSTHGIKSDDGRLYFAFPNTKCERLNATALSSAFVNEMMSGSRSKRHILLLDCCYSGAFLKNWTAKGDTRVGVRDSFEGSGKVILTASDSMQYALEGQTLSGTRPSSLFTRAIVEGLRTGGADRDRNGLISVDELYQFAVDRVKEQAPKQRPLKFVLDVDGEIIVGYSSTSVQATTPNPGAHLHGWSHEGAEPDNYRRSGGRLPSTERISGIKHNPHAPATTFTPAQSHPSFLQPSSKLQYPKRPSKKRLLLSLTAAGISLLTAYAAVKDAIIRRDTIDSSYPPPPPPDTVSKDARAKSDAYWQEGMDALKRGDLAKAKQLCWAAYNADPTSAKAANSLGDIELKEWQMSRHPKGSGPPDRVPQWYKYAEAQDPSYVPILVNLTGYYLDYSKNNPTACEYMQKTFSIAPDDPNTKRLCDRVTKICPCK